MKLLVTGAAGFIGSNFVRYCMRMTLHQIVIIDKLTYAGNIQNLIDLLKLYPKRLKLIIADICHREAIQEIFQTEQFDALLNFAAESHVDRSILNASPFIQTNITGTQNLLELARLHQIPRFLQVSTDEVYGSLNSSSPSSLETDCLLPNSPYSASKASADLLCRAAFQTYQQNVIVTRCSNNYGPYQFPEKLIPLMIIKAYRYEKLPIYGDGLQIRDWVYVTDHCRALLAALEHGQAGEIYNIKGTKEATNLEIVKTILTIMKRPENLITHVQDRLGHDRRYSVNADKLQQLCSWKPEVSFEEGLQKTIQWYISNGDWWRDIMTGDYLKFYQTNYGLE